MSVKILDQEWRRNAQAQLERLDVPALIGLLYKTVENQLADAPDCKCCGTGLKVGQNKFADGRLAWDVTISGKTYTSAWGATLHGALVEMIMRYQVVEWGK